MYLQQNFHLPSVNENRPIGQRRIYMLWCRGKNSRQVRSYMPMSTARIFLCEVNRTIQFRRGKKDRLSYIGGVRPHLVCERRCDYTQKRTRYEFSGLPCTLFFQHRKRKTDNKKARDLRAAVVGQVTTQSAQSLWCENTLFEHRTKQPLPPERMWETTQQQRKDWV